MRIWYAESYFVSVANTENSCRCLSIFSATAWSSNSFSFIYSKAVSQINLIMIMTISTTTLSSVIQLSRMNSLLSSKKSFTHTHANIFLFHTVMIGDGKLFTTTLCIGWTYKSHRNIYISYYINFALTPLGTVFTITPAVRGIEYGCCCLNTVSFKIPVDGR